MKRFAALALVCALTPVSAVAGDGRWTSGYGQGHTEATVTNARGATFYIDCPDAGLGQNPGVTLEPRGLTGGEPAAGLGVLIMIDNQSTAWPLDRRVLDQNQVVFTADASTSAQKAALRTLIQRLGRGRSVTVAIPSQQLRETFTLAGSGGALSQCEIH